MSLGLFILVFESPHERDGTVVPEDAFFMGAVEVVFDEAEVEAGALRRLHVGVVAREGDAGGCGGWRVHRVAVLRVG